MSARIAVVGQVDEEDLVEASLADQLRRQRGDVVGRRDDEHASTCVSASQVRNAPSRRREVPLSPSPVARPFSISSIHSTHGAMTLGGRQRLAQIALRLADVLVVDRAEVQPQQRHAEDAGRGARRDALAAALHAEQQHAFRRLELRRGAVEGRLAQLQPLLEPRHAAEVGELRGVVLEAEHAAAIEQFVLGLHDAPAGRSAAARRRRRSPCAPAARCRRPTGRRGSRPAARATCGRCAPCRRCVRVQSAATFSMIAWRSARSGNASRKRAARCSSSRGSAISWLISTSVRARAVVVLADVLQQPHVHRVGQERVEVEQHVDAGDGRWRGST